MQKRVAFLVTNIHYANATQRMLGPNFPFIRSHEQGNRLVSNIITSLLKTRKHYVQMENNREISSM